MKIIKSIKSPWCALAAIGLLSAGFALAQNFGFNGVQPPPMHINFDPLQDGHGIQLWAWSNPNSGPTYPNSGAIYDAFQTFGNFNFQTPQNGVLFSGAFAGSANQLTNLPSTSLIAFTNTPPPASTNAPVGWFTITDTNGVSYRVALYR